MDSVARRVEGRKGLCELILRLQYKQPSEESGVISSYHQKRSHLAPGSAFGWQLVAQPRMAVGSLPHWPLSL